MIVSKKKVFLKFWQNLLGRNGILKPTSGKHRNREMSEFEPKTIEGNWINRPISNATRYVQYLGLDAVTVRFPDNTPFFFLFIDIDEKDPQGKLRDALNICREKRLYVYFYETCKGWHIISPCLLRIRNWMGILMRLKRVQDSSGDTIRWTTRHCDGKILYTSNWNTKRKFHQESYDLHYYIREKYQVDFKDFRFDLHTVSTKLQWKEYNQLRVTTKRHVW